MYISILINETLHKVGEMIPEENIMTKVPCGELLLMPAEQNPEGEEVLVVGKAYGIKKNRYDLESGYAICAVIRDGELVPKLRRSKGQERYATTKLVKKSHRHQAVRIGDLLDWWPETQRLWKDNIPTDVFVDEALNIIGEVGEIDENFALPTEPLEYVENEESLN